MANEQQQQGSENTQPNNPLVKQERTLEEVTEWQKDQPKPVTNPETGLPTPSGETLDDVEKGEHVKSEAK